MKQSGSDRLGSRFSRRRFLVLGGLSVAGLAAMGWEGLVREIIHLSIEKIKIPLSGLVESFSLAHISDLHYGDGHTPCDSLASSIKALKPDAVVITGDVIGSARGREKARRLISLMGLPCFVVSGNWESYLKWTPEEQERFYKSAGAELLCNATTFLPWGGGVNLIGVDDPFSGLDDLERASAGTTSGKPSVLLAHAPLIASRASFRKIDATLCGHTHGGQIRLPFFGAVVVPPGSDGFEMGLYDVNGMKLYVNRGIGTCIMPVRFMCPAELALIEFVPA